MTKYFLFLANLSFFCFIGVVGFTYFTKTTGYAELLSHFALSFFLISIIYFVFYMFFRHKLFMAFAVITCAVTAYPWIFLLAPADNSKHVGRGDEVSILQLNILYEINNVEAFL